MAVIVKPQLPPPRPLQPCGTLAAYWRHKRRGEPIDDACRQAYNAEHRRLYLQRKTNPEEEPS